MQQKLVKKREAGRKERHKHERTTATGVNKISLKCRENIVWGL